MGIETAIIIGLGVAAAASSGYQAKRSHDQREQASDEKKDAMKAQAGLQQDALDKQKQKEATQAAAALRARQRAYQSSIQPSQASQYATELGGLGGADAKRGGMLGL